MLKFRSALFLFLFSAGFAKTLFFPSTFVDAAVLLIAGLVFSYMEYKNQDKRLTELDALVKAHAQEISVLQDKVSSIKIIQQTKPNALGFRS